MLAAIEDERFDQLPGGVFNKGFIRAYARQVGLDEDETVADYLTALRESQIQSQAATPNFRRDARPVSPPALPPSESHRDAHTREIDPAQSEDRRARADRRMQLRRSADRGNEFKSDYQHDERYAAPAEKHHEEFSEEEDEIPTAPPSFLNLSPPAENYYQPEPERNTREASSAPTVRWRNLIFPLVLLTIILALWGFHRRKIAAASSPTTAQSATPQPVAVSESAVVAAPSPAATVSSPIAKPAPSHSTPAPPVTVPVTPPQRKAPQPKPLPTFTLVIRAAKTSWISVTADGQPVAHETLIAPAHTSVRATKEIMVRAGNAAGISFQLNHLEIPPQGGEGEVRIYTFDANGLRDSSPSAPTAR